MSTKVILPIEYFADPSVGRPISNASIYIGEVDTDPEIVGNQIDVTAHEEDGSTFVIDQPISTGSGGVPLYDGSPIKLTVESDYSIKVLDSLGVQMYLSSSVTAPINASEIVYDNTGSGMTADDVQDAIDELKTEIDEPVAAEDVTFDNAVSGMDAEDVQAAIDELAATPDPTVAAEDVTYDNAASGLTADDVQEAIDELAAADDGTSGIVTGGRFFRILRQIPRWNHDL